MNCGFEHARDLNSALNIAAILDHLLRFGTVPDYLSKAVNEEVRGAMHSSSLAGLDALIDCAPRRPKLQPRVSLPRRSHARASNAAVYVSMATTLPATVMPVCLCA